MTPTPRIALLALVVLGACVPAASAAPTGPAVVFGGVDCDAGGVAITLGNSSGGPLRFTLLRGDAAVSSVVLPAGVTNVRRVVPLAEGAASHVTVRYGSSYTSSFVQRSCTTAAPEAARSTAAVGDAPFGAVRVASPTGVRGADAAPTVAERPADRRVGDEVTIDDGTPVWPFVVGGIAAALAALAALLLTGRLRLPGSARRREPAARQRG